MVKLAGPMMSLDASGKLANTLVFSKWKGRNYCRQLVTPANPKSGGQTGMRSMFKFLSQIWNGLTDGNKATWEDRADTNVISPFNAFMSRNQFLWRDFLPPGNEDPVGATGTPGAITNEAATAGERSITLGWDVGVGAEQWGCAIFRSPTGTFTPGWDNCIAVVDSPASASDTYIDSPLDPGTYYYEIRPFTDDGLWGTASTEVDDTVT